MREIRVSGEAGNLYVAEILWKLQNFKIIKHLSELFPYDSLGYSYFLFLPIIVYSFINNFPFLIYISSQGKTKF